MKIFLICVCFMLSCGTAVEMQSVKSHQNTFKYFVSVTTDSIDISWDLPPLTDVKKYQLLYRPYDKTTWKILKDSVPATTTPHVVVYEREFEQVDLMFVVGVRYVTTANVVSDIHWNTDPTALPNGGWVLVFKK